MCSLAGVQPLPNNGSWSRVECMLRNTAPLAPLPPRSSCVLALALLSLFARQISLLWSLNNVSQCHQQLHLSLSIFLKFLIWIIASLIEFCPPLLHCAPPGMNLTHPAFTMILTWSQILCCSKHSQGQWCDSPRFTALAVRAESWLAVHKVFWWVHMGNLWATSTSHPSIFHWGAHPRGLPYWEVQEWRSTSLHLAGLIPSAPAPPAAEPHLLLIASAKPCLYRHSLQRAKSFAEAP